MCSWDSDDGVRLTLPRNADIRATDVEGVMRIL
jgi:hypothetical protein